VGRRDDAQRLGVAGGEDRRGASVREAHPTSEVSRLVATVGAVTNPFRRQPDPHRRQLLGEAALAVPARGEAKRVLDRVADEADRGVPEIEQVPSGECATRDVVANHSGHGSRPPAVDVDEPRGPGPRQDGPGLGARRE
jgi:hypothetical protein